MAKDKLLTLREAADHLRVSERSLYRYIRDGKIRATKIGYWRISEKDIDDFIQQNSNLRRRKP